MFSNQVEEVTIKRETRMMYFFYKMNDNIYKIELGSDLIFTFLLILAPNRTWKQLVLLTKWFHVKLHMA